MSGFGHARRRTWRNAPGQPGVRYESGEAVRTALHASESVSRLADTLAKVGTVTWKVDGGLEFDTKEER